jgi:poly-gamma-glutamate synthesis protein (capsule biosynthesis protein)
MKTPVESYLKSHPKAKITLTSGDNNADIYIDKSPRKGFDATRIEGCPAMELTAGKLQKTLRPQRDYWFCYKRTGIVLKVKNEEIAELEDYLTGYYDAIPPITAAAVGDIIPGRHVAEQMAQRGTDWPFKRIASVVRGAQVTFGDLECPLSDLYPPPYDGMEFIAPAKTIDGIKMLGMDFMTLANNHSTNFGRPAFSDTLRLLKANNIKYAGGGNDYTEAHRPAIVEAGGVKFAFLSYNGIEGSINASAAEPGVAWIGIEPWSPDNPEDFDTVEREVMEARKQADFVIACFHWSKEYEYRPNPSMVALARRACDAGADMVIGQHPHSIQSLEYYKGKFIAYSLGNFIFDQRFSEQVREGVVLKCRFKNNILVALELIPYRINDTCQTVPYNGAKGQPLLDKLFKISGWKTRGPSI